MTKLLSLFFLLFFSSKTSYGSDQHVIVGWDYGNGKVMYCGLGYMMSPNGSYLGDFFEHNAEKTLFVNMVKKNSFVTNPTVGIFYSLGTTGYPNAVDADTLIAILGRAGITGVKVTSDMIDTQAEINNYNVLILGGSGQWGGEIASGYLAVQSVVKNFVQNDHGGVIFAGWSVYTLEGINATDYNDMIPVNIPPGYGYQMPVGYTLLKHLPADPLFLGVGTLSSTGWCEFPMGDVKPGAISYGGLAPYTNPAIPADPTSISVTANPICYGLSTQLTANGVDGTVYWYTSSCGGTQLTTGNPITITPSVTTTYYAKNYNNSEYSTGCASVTVTVNQIPVATATPASAVICSGTATSIALTSAPTGSAFDWTVATASGMVTGASASSGTSIAQTLSGNGITNYTVTPTLNSCTGLPITVAVTVNPLPSIAVAGSNLYTYDGTLKTASATVGTGETIDWYAGATGGSPVSVPSGTNVGTYSAYAEARNTTTGCVSVSRVLVSLQITAKAIIVTANAGQTKIYGASNPTPYTYTFAPSLFGADAITGLMGRTVGENVGTYVYTIGTLTAGLNYSLSVAATPTFSITAKPIVITATAGQTKIFGASDPAPFTYALAPALIGSDAITGLLGRAAGENVGNYAFTMGTLSAGSNYTLSLAITPEFSITPKAIVILATAGQTKVYGAVDPAPFTYTFSPALVGADVITGLMSRVSGENVGNYAYTLGTLAISTNYTLSVSAATYFSISQKALTVKADDKVKCYNGAIYSGGYTVTYTGFVNGEGPGVLTGSLVYGGTAIAAISFGTYTIIPSGLTSLNYSITHANGNLTIEEAPAPTIAGSNSLCAGTSAVQYTTEPGFSNYIWTISYGGIIVAGQNTNQVTVNWGIAGSRTIAVNYENANGCFAIVPSIYAITVLSVPVPIISGENSLCQGTSGVAYTTQLNYDSYTWTVSSGGAITSGAGTNAITVNWTGSGSQSVSVEYINNLGCAPLAPTAFNVFVTPLPVTPVITQHGDTLTSSSASGNQWYLNGVMIAGATAQQHIAVYTGNYKVVVTTEGCSSGASNSILVLPVSINDIEVSQEFEVYPNPNQGQFNIRVTTATRVELNIEIFNNVGLLVWKQENESIDGTKIIPVSLDDISKGVYMVCVRNAKTNMVKRVVIMK